MDQQKLKQLQQQYEEEEDDGEDGYDELLQDNSEMYHNQDYVEVIPKKGNPNKLGGIITQVEQGSTQPKVQSEDEIPSDFFVNTKIVIGPPRK
jgi:hypothetical protein